MEKIDVNSGVTCLLIIETTQLDILQHDILDRQFNSTYNPVDSVGSEPDPSTFALIGLELPGMIGAARRKQYSCIKDI